MSTATTTTHTPPQFGDVPYDVTADDFFHLIETGFFPEEARVYLEDGRIYEKMAKTTYHSGLGSHVPIALNRRLPAGWLAFSESQIKLDRKNSPLPDVAVVRCNDAREFAEAGRWPESADIGLIVEVAVTSLAKDLGRNLERYARNGVPNYWVADVLGQRLHVHSRPHVVDGRGEYAEAQVVEPGGAFALVLDGGEPIRFAYEDLMFRKVPPPEVVD